jgi:ribonuclease HI
MTKMYFDGGAAPNPGPAHVCVKLGDEFHFSEIGFNTNNMAEWLALLWGMSLAREQGIKELQIIGDSQLIINQANGTYKIRKPEFLPMKREFDALVVHFAKISLTFGYREHNLAGQYIERHVKNRQYRNGVSQSKPACNPWQP